MIEAKYANLCHICQGELKTSEIEAKKCSITKKPLCYFKEEEATKEFLDFFEKAIGKARALQIFWAKRVLRNQSFAAVAPTGIGKSSFGIAMALFLAGKGKKSYILFPTTLLVQQATEMAEKIKERTGSKAEILFYHGNIKNKEEFFEKLQKKEFDVLITTTQFLAKHFDKLSNFTFDFIFVDDVDAILKASKNVDRILQLLGFYFDNGWKGKAKGVLMVSTATAKKGRKAELFRRLLNFDVGSSHFAIRNIDDIYINDESYETIKNLLKKLGSGGIIYARSSEEAEEWHEKLKEDFQIGLVTAKSKKAFQDFKEGKLDFLIGTAYYYGALIRGIDLPKEIKYAVFIGAPVIRIRIEDIDSLSPNMIKFIASLLREREEIKKFVPLLPTIEKRREFQELKERIKIIMEEGIGKEEDFVLRQGEIILPDIRTYIQGSGRTSRLLAGGITKGLSFLFEDDEELLHAFRRRASYYDIEFKGMDEIDIEKAMKEVEESRRIKKREEEDLIKPALFVVESPTKAKQIARFFGKPSIKAIGNSIVYEVASENHILLITASLGHLTDLITGEAFHGVEVNGKFIPIYATIKKCMDCGYQFTEERKECPKCGSKNINDARERIDALRNIAYEAGNIIIGTDPDAEGEKIAWDIANLLAGCGEIKRAEFHEITPAAIKKAMKNLRDIDENLVKAQIVRRIEDRWIGFCLSQKLWEVFNNRNLSAGRAQTPVLGWIIKRAEEHKERRKVGIIQDFGIVLEGIEKGEVEIEIKLIEAKKEMKNPLPPYTTDEVLRDANSILKIPANKTMKLLQDLFESGLITYHRTDSTYVSEAGLKIAREFLGADFHPRQGTQHGAHECIRPTRPWDKNLLHRLIQENVIQVEEMTWQHLALYDLIFRRFMASQCKPFEVEMRKYRIKYDGREMEETRVIKAEGKAYELYRSVAVKRELPEGIFRKRAIIKMLPKSPLFTQSEVIHTMKEKGIGRPSTYATIVEKLFMRNYVVEKNGRLLPTKRGLEIYSFLASNYGEFVSEERTRKIEEEMDMVESGKADYMQLLQQIYEEVKSIK
ncbi:MAG: reverse gyrase [Thermoplasmata archaeon]|nr:reverse gyrase [Thermoplasmata archaeon]